MIIDFLLFEVCECLNLVVVIYGCYDELFFDFFLLGFLLFELFLFGFCFGVLNLCGFKIFFIVKDVIVCFVFGVDLFFGLEILCVFFLLLFRFFLFLLLMRELIEN